MLRIVERYRLPDSYIKFVGRFDPAGPEGYFTLGTGTVCFGSCDTALASIPGDGMVDVRDRVRCRGGVVEFPFSPDQLADNLLLERYPTTARNATPDTALWGSYYALRPFLPGALRRRLQRRFLSGWENIAFPRWPVDVSVEQMFEACLIALMQAQGIDRLPFIWFWPEGHDSAAIVTHDVEGEKGKRLCAALMDIDDSFRVKASFQIVPEGRYSVSPAFLSQIRRRGFEINVQDLNHDGRLLESEKQFMQRVVSVNRYGRQFEASGFRAAVLYRNLRWWHALEFEYDMSVPNVAHLEPQRGGCCTVFPYFVGHLLELPATTTQDYALFHHLNQFSSDLWERQIDRIREHHGLISILVHPDYIFEAKERSVYLQLLRFLDELRAAKNAWIATPGQVNAWWRARSTLRLISDAAGWRIVGNGHERARLPYAHREGDRIRFEVVARASALHAALPRTGTPPGLTVPTRPREADP